MNKQLADKLKTLPSAPGVYFHHDSKGRVIYVGKAAILKNRVRQYFQSQKDMDVKTRALVAEIHDTTWVETNSELDALFLESEMVKRYKPRFNILLRDDKSVSYVRIDIKSEWPTVSFTRTPLDDGAEYLGPYFGSFAIKKAMRSLRQIFPYLVKQRGKESKLDSQIGLSPSPDITSAEYKKSLRQMIRYMKGDRQKVIDKLQKSMLLAASKQQFELAAKFRNQLSLVRALKNKIMFGDKEFLDVSKDRALKSLVELFGLNEAPKRIEAYDISHQSGQNVVASMVTFINGVSDRAEYRKFKLSERNDDTGNIYATLTRRLSEKNLREWGQPDLILIDGGKGQLEAAIKAVESSGLKIPTISIAKREEEIVVHSEKSNIKLDRIIELLRKPILTVSITPSGSFYVINLHVGASNAGGHSKNLHASTTGEVSPYDDAVKLFQRLRDESHRFAITYHSHLKRKTMLK